MLLSDLQSKDIINIKDGNNLGKIIDAYIDNDGKIIYFVAEEKKMIKKFIKSGSANFNYENIKKIGEDVILIEL